MSPFIVTTKQRGECTCAMTEATMVNCEVHGYEATEDGLVVDERRAVATLEEARDVVYPVVQRWGHEQAHKQCMTISESGGSVGPLPNGRALDVRLVPQSEARRDLRVWGSKLDTVRSTDDVIARAWADAFNAREAGQ